MTKVASNESRLNRMCMLWILRGTPSAQIDLSHNGGGAICGRFSAMFSSQLCSTAQAPGFSSTEFRTALGMFATGVTIVTARTPTGDLVGLTANSFNSVSLTPPLVLWSLSQAASAMEAFSQGSHYAINILAADQHALALRFATRGADRFAELDFTSGRSGAPLITGSVATFECFNRSRYVEGDHVIFVGEVEHCSHRAGASPLLYHGGKFYVEHPL